MYLSNDISAMKCKSTGNLYPFDKIASKSSFITLVRNIMHTKQNGSSKWECKISFLIHDYDFCRHFIRF